ncbi:MAG: hypothetical protein GTO41_07185, partial [Burkholderiales bacterium]|nr:hypothetical protein [Burkholderiales bacterium]
LFLVVILLMGIGPVLPWRKANVSSLRKRLAVPVILGLAGAMMMVILWPVHWTASVAVGLIVFVLATIVMDFLRATKQ